MVRRVKFTDRTSLGVRVCRYQSYTDAVTPEMCTVLHHIWSTSHHLLRLSASHIPSSLDNPRGGILRGRDGNSTCSESGDGKALLEESLMWLKQLAKFPARYLEVAELAGPLQTNLAWCALELGDTAGAVRLVSSQSLNSCTTGLQKIRLL